jgi:hypothetical protein
MKHENLEAPANSPYLSETNSLLRELPSDAALHRLAKEVF